MVPIPLKPSAPIARDDPPAGDRRRSLFTRLLRGTRWLAAGPLDWAGGQRIWQGGALIGTLLDAMKVRPAADARFKTEGRGIFDLQATAFCLGISVHQLEARLRARQLHTARLAYVTFALAWLFLAGWTWQAVSTPLSVLQATSALYFLPFCALFFLVSFHNALINFQIRSGRLASWREYLLTSERFWPC